MPMEQRIRLIRTEERVEDTLRGKCCAERDETPREELGVDRNIWVDAQERGRCKTAKTVETCEDFVKDDGEACPVVGVVATVARGACGLRRCAEEMRRFADRVHEGSLEEGIAVRKKGVKCQLQNRSPGLPRGIGGHLHELHASRAENDGL